MPQNDGTGPTRQGAGTGKGRGPCGGGQRKGPAAGAGKGQGRGRGWRNTFHATGLPGWARGTVPVTPAPAQELAILKQQAEQFGNALENLRQRIREIENQPAEK